MQDSVKQGAEGASEAFASATGGGKTKTAYQRGKDGVASASAYASDVGNAVSAANGRRLMQFPGVSKT